MIGMTVKCLAQENALSLATINRTQYIVPADHEARLNCHTAAIAPVKASSTLHRRNLKAEV